MELFSTEFFAALAAIIVIDLVLAGDNAIVIALAARSLPPRRRQQAIVWGTIGAIAVRAALTAVVVWLLRIPGLMFFGGLMLIWIAYRLLVPKESGGDGHEVGAADSFWGAMGTIVIADAMMGLDNVLAVAGAAHGSYLLVVLGLLISIPIVVWGSRLVLRLIDKFPQVIYIGAAVLAWTAAKMMAGEPVVRDAVATSDHVGFVLQVVAVLGVVGLAALRNRFRRQDRLEAKLGRHAQDAAEDGTMFGRVLVPMDGSACAMRALETVLARTDGRNVPEVHLVNVQTPFAHYIGRFLAKRDLTGYLREQALRELGPAMQLLNERGVRFMHHLRTGDAAMEIGRLANTLEASRVVIGAAPRNTVGRLVQDEATQRLLRFTHAPVELVAGQVLSPVERLAVPAGVSAGLAVLLLTLD